MPKERLTGDGGGAAPGGEAPTRLGTQVLDAAAIARLEGAAADEASLGAMGGDAPGGDGVPELTRVWPGTPPDNASVPAEIPWLIKPNQLLDNGETEPVKHEAPAGISVPSGREVSGEVAQQDPTVVIVQDSVPGSAKLRSVLSEDIRRNPDRSTWKTPQQPTDGIEAMAHVFADRERERQQAQQAAQNQKADSEAGQADSDTKPDEQKASDREPPVVWSFTHDGIELQGFLNGLREADPEGTVTGDVRYEVACDSDEKIAGIRGSGMFKDLGDRINYSRADPQRDPESVRLPPNTAAALVTTLGELPARQVYRDGARMFEQQEQTGLAGGDQPLVAVDERGYAEAVNPNLMGKYGIANAPADRRQLLPQIAARLQETSMPFFLSATTLSRKTQDVRGTMASVPDILGSAIINHAPGVEKFVQAVTAGVRDDGLIYVGGDDLIRDARVGADAWLHPDLKGEVTAGPILRRSVVEATAVVSGARRADPDAAVTVVGDGGSQEFARHMIVDRSRAPGEAGQAEAVFRETLTAFEQRARRAAPTESTIEKLLGTLSAMETTAEKEMIAGILRGQLDTLEKANPRETQNYDRYLGLAEALAADGLIDMARDYAERAAALAPLSSAPYVIIARIELQHGNDDEAGQALAKARQLNPDNPEVYQAALEHFERLVEAELQAGPPSAGSQGSTLARLLPHYRRALIDYLRTDPALGNKARVELIQKITQTLGLEAREHHDNPGPAKTYIVENLTTGELETRSISVSQLTGIRAARAYRNNGAVACALLNAAGADPQLEDEVAAWFMAGWEQTVPRDNDGNALASDAWADQPASRNERWHYMGSIDQSDAETSDQDLQDLLDWAAEKQSEMDEAAEHATAAEQSVVPRLPRLSEVPRSSLIGGTRVSRSGLLIPGEPAFEFLAKDLLGQGFLSARTRMGKTVLLESLAGQITRLIGNPKFWLYDLSDKIGLDEAVDRLKARGIPITSIHWGNNDYAPPSLDILNPLNGDPAKQAALFARAWVVGFGGSTDSPVGPIVRTATKYAFLENGYPVMLDDIEKEALPRIISYRQQPIKPAQIWGHIERAAELYMYGDASALGPYFKNRINDIESGPLFEHLFGSNRVNWPRMIDTNMHLTYEALGDRDQRGFLFACLTLQLLSYAATNLPNTSQLRLMQALDEVGPYIQKPGPNADTSTVKAIEAFGDAIRQQGAKGVAALLTTQTQGGVDTIFTSQNGVGFAGATKQHEDIKAALESFGYEEGKPEYEEAYKVMIAAQPGEFLAWHSGMRTPVRVQVMPDPVPTQEAIDKARQWQPKPPLLEPGAFNATVTFGERKVGIQNSRLPERASLRDLAATTTMGHLASSQEALPIRAPRELHAWWQAVKAKGPEALREAKIELRAIAKNAVETERGQAIDQVYPSEELTRSVYAHLQGLLDGEPSTRTPTRVSPHFALPQVEATLALHKLTDSIFDHTPSPDSVAFMDLPGSLRSATEYRAEESRTDDPTPDGSSRTWQRVGELITGLNRHVHSPRREPHNGQTAYTAVYGRNNGVELFRDLHAEHRALPNVVRQRRLEAATHGQVDSFHEPRRSELERLLRAAGGIALDAIGGSSKEKQTT